MTNHRRLGLTALAITLTTATAAHAAAYRLPQSGGPAVAVTAPDDWTATRLGEATLNLTNAVRDGVISITMETVPPDASLTTFRDNVFKAAHCAAMDRTETLRLGGRSGQAFYCQPAQSQLAPARIVLIRLGETHILSVSHTYRLDATGADVQGLEAVLATVRYEDVGP